MQMSRSTITFIKYQSLFVYKAYTVLVNKTNRLEVNNINNFKRYFTAQPKKKKE